MIDFNYLLVVDILTHWSLGLCRLNCIQVHANHKKKYTSNQGLSFAFILLTVLILIQEGFKHNWVQ